MGIQSEISVTGTDEESRVEMSITPVIDKMLRQAPFFLHLQMLLAKRKPLQDGRYHYDFILKDTRKIKALRQLAVMAAFKFDRVQLN